MDATQPSQQQQYLSLAGVILPPLLTAIITWTVAMWRIRRRAALRFEVTLARIQDSVDSVKEQVYTNGGASLRDVANRIEQRLIISDERARAYHFHDPHPVWESDSHGHIDWCNPALAKLLGVSTEDLRGKGWLGMVHEADRDDVEQQLERAEEYGHNLTFNCRMIRPGNLPVLRMESRWKRVLGHDRKTVGYVGTVLSSSEIKGRGE